MSINNSCSFKTSYIATSTMCRYLNVCQAGKLWSSIASSAISCSPLSALPLTMHLRTNSHIGGHGHGANLLSKIASAGPVLSIMVGVTEFTSCKLLIIYSGLGVV